MQTVNTADFGRFAVVNHLLIESLSLLSFFRWIRRYIALRIHRCARSDLSTSHVRMPGILYVEIFCFYMPFLRADIPGLKFEIHVDCLSLTIVCTTHLHDGTAMTSLLPQTSMQTAALEHGH